MKVKKVFDFIQKNSNLVTEASGMSSTITGLDRNKLVMLAKEYGIELVSYDYFLDAFERRLLERQAEILKTSN